MGKIWWVRLLGAAALLGLINVSVHPPEGSKIAALVPILGPAVDNTVWELGAGNYVGFLLHAAMIGWAFWLAYTAFHKPKPKAAE
jgi:hypothetical protein